MPEAITPVAFTSKQSISPMENHFMQRIDPITKNNSRCIACGFIRYNETGMTDCPKCRSKNVMTDSYEAPQEAVNLFCDALKIGPKSYAGNKIKQAVDILYNSL